MYLPSLAIGLIVAIVCSAAPDAWNSVASLRRALPAEAKPVAHWSAGDAAFLAAVDAGKRVHSVVRLGEGRVEIRFDGSVNTAAKTTRVTSLDLEGARVGNSVVLFHTEAGLARSALSFDTGSGSGRLRYIVTGIAPGMWEIWRDGWVVDIGVPVRAGEGVLSFEDRPGSYFVRRLN